MRITRRRFLTTTALTAGAWTAGVATMRGQGPRVDAAALRQRIEALSVFGRPAGGTFADGVSRVAYSDADVAGRRYVMDLMRAAGLEPRIDPAANIFGRRPGLGPLVPSYAFAVPRHLLIWRTMMKIVNAMIRNSTTLLMNAP